MESLVFLERVERLELKSIYVLHGDEDFLKRRVLVALRLRLFGPDGDDFSSTSLTGDQANFSQVRSELETVPFLSPHRLVVVEQADPFVSANRAALESYFTKPSGQGILVLAVKTWQSTTKLAKLLDDAGTIICKAPPPYKVPEWCSRWATSHYHKQLPADAARLLVELAGPDMGLLDQELDKLSIYVGAADHISSADVDLLVGSGRNANLFRIFDALAEGKPAEAVGILEQLFDQGDDPLKVLGAFSYQLRRLAQAARLAQNGTSMNGIAERLAIWPKARPSFEQQLRRLGRARLERLYDWLLEADLGMKGRSALPPRTVLERLLVKLLR